MTDANQAIKLAFDSALNAFRFVDGNWPDGTVALPGAKFTLEVGTGVSRPGAGIFAFSTVGVERMRFDGNIITFPAASQIHGPAEIRVSSSGTFKIGGSQAMKDAVAASGRLLELGTQFNGCSIKADASAPTDTDLVNGSMNFWIDEVADEVEIRVKKSDGTLFSKTIA